MVILAQLLHVHPVKALKWKISQLNLQQIGGQLLTLLQKHVPEWWSGDPGGCCQCLVMPECRCYLAGSGWHLQAGRGRRVWKAGKDIPPLPQDSTHSCWCPPSLAIQTASANGGWAHRVWEAQAKMCLSLFIIPYRFISLGGFSSLQSYSYNLTSRNAAPNFVQRQKLLGSPLVLESAGRQPRVRKRCPGKRVMKVPTLLFKQFAFLFPSRNSL